MEQGLIQLLLLVQIVEGINMFDLNLIFGVITTQMLDFQQRWAEYYETIFDKVVSLMALANQSGIYGHADNQNYYDQINNFNYLFLYLYIIRQEYQAEEQLFNAGIISELVTVQELAENYSLDCIRKSMLCNGYNVLPFYQLFDLNYMNVQTLDGIGYMAINPNNTAAPDFRVS